MGRQPMTPKQPKTPKEKLTLAELICDWEMEHSDNKEWRAEVLEVKQFLSDIKPLTESERSMSMTEETQKAAKRFFGPELYARLKALTEPKRASRTKAGVQISFTDKFGPPSKPAATRTKQSKPPTSFKELKGLATAQELTTKFTALMGNVLNSPDVENKSGAIDSLVQEYTALVKSALDSPDAKGSQPGQKGQPQKSGVITFFGPPKQAPGAKLLFDKEFLNGKVNHR